MGNGASMQAQTALNSEAAKPLDARDVTNLEYAKIELINARKQAQFYRNQSLPKYQIDTTGDGRPNAIGYDTNRNGFIDSLDTTMDGLIDTVVVKHGTKLFYVPASMIGINILTTGGGNGEHYITNSEPKSSGSGTAVAVVAGALAVGGLVAATNMVGGGNSFSGNGTSNEMIGTAIVGSQMVPNGLANGAVNGAQQLGENMAMVGSTLQQGGQQALNNAGQIVNQENMAMVGSTLQQGGQQALEGGANVVQESGNILEQVLHTGEDVIGEIAHVGADVVKGIGSVVSGIGNAVKTVLD